MKCEHDCIIQITFLCFQEVEADTDSLIFLIADIRTSVSKYILQLQKICGHMQDQEHKILLTIRLEIDHAHLRFSGWLVLKPSVLHVCRGFIRGSVNLQDNNNKVKGIRIEHRFNDLQAGGKKT